MDLEDGTFYGSSSGFKNRDVEVEVTVVNGVIEEIEILDCGCTSPEKGVDFEDAVDDLAQEILDTQSTNLDSVSGATKSTKGLLEAVEEALNE